MFISYDYSEFLQEFLKELNDEILTIDSRILIVRKEEPVFECYHPIIDWYYIDNELEEGIVVTPATVGEVIAEMEKWNRII
jgi:hypothetical protein